MGVSFHRIGVIAMILHCKPGRAPSSMVWRGECPPANGAPMHQLHRLSGRMATICTVEALPADGYVGARPFVGRARPSGSNRKTTQM
jgi:hypothetical protein